ncbi:hypothetical protein J7I93_09495 [Bacillus sp. ISL-47]|uniref:hypothetical protein n=1 Tax=Bacillus sp. ISL-47 TaxID=2819130 RepID=UPI001BE88140|nr:hypothetical protein [Bacillus sp. ISL-47]MBT2688414.1 hypothetical protein [Bacillus sp. ISL-47]MBT2707270.1 hypothetical protein [Pseudomonas sp. ISL-84]
MGSRVMHAIIANEIASRLELKDKSAFILGGIAPDAVSPKEYSHFYRGDTNDYSRTIGYKEFLKNTKAYVILSFDQIIGYVEISVDRGVFELNSV